MLKGSRVREYHKENLAILAAPERDPFQITYARRWIETDLHLSAGEGGVIAFSDSPYKHFIPVRFAVIDSVDETSDRIRINGHLGPFVMPLDNEALDERWSARTDDQRPGQRFLFRDEVAGLKPPQGVDELDGAWRACIDSLAVNGYFAQSTIARVVRVTDPNGLEVSTDEPVALGTKVTVEVETRTPVAEIDAVSALVTAFPSDALDHSSSEFSLPATGTGRFEVCPVYPGDIELRMSLRPEPARSSRPRVRFTAVEDPSPAVAVFEAGGARADVMGVAPSDVVMFLRRSGDLDDDTWIHLLDEVLLPAAPEDPALLAQLADHALATESWSIAQRALAALRIRSPEQDAALLAAAVRTDHVTDIRDLLSSADLGSDTTFDPILDAVAESPTSAVEELLRAVLDGRQLGDDKLLALVEASWPRINSIDLLCSAAEGVVYVEPLTVARLLADRWPNPTAAPHRVVDLLIDWEIDPHGLVPFLEQRLTDAGEGRRWEDLEALIDKIERVAPTSDRPDLLLRAGRYLLAADDEDAADRGFAYLCRAANDACRNGDIDLAIDAGVSLRAAATTPVRREALAETQQTLNDAIERSEALERWEAMQIGTAAERLRPRMAGRRLHVVGGWRPDWAETLRDELQLSDLRWHETSKDGAIHADWTAGLDERDVVLAVTSHIGHAMTDLVKQRCQAADVPYATCRRGQQSVLDALDRLVQSTATHPSNPRSAGAAGARR